MKMADTTNNGHINASSAQTLSAPTPPFPIDLKKTKIVWGQPAHSAPLTWTETMMDLVAFRNMLQDRTTDGPLTTIPSEHLRLISELTQESDKDLKGLVMDIQAALAPESMSTSNVSSSNSASRKDNDLIPAKVVESAINGVANRINYGIDGGLKDFCVWRWEVQDLNNLPARLRDSLRQRRADREAAHSILLARFQAIPETERKALLTKANQKKMEASASGKENIRTSEPPAVGASAIATASVPDVPTAPSQPTPATVEPQTMTTKTEVSTEKKEKDPKPKKATATKQKESAPANSNKSSLFKYFAPKSNQTAPSTTKAQTDVISNDVKPEPKKPAFEEIFRPFRVKKGTDLAPSNYFKLLKNDVIVLDHDGDDTMKTDNKSAPEDLLDTLKNTLAPVSKPRRTSYKRIHSSAPPLKTTSQLSVRDLIEQFSDATLAGDVNTAKLLVATLSDRKKLPVSWLYFHENLRPMYVGTWTKTSTVIGPRSPFAKEEGIDYAYDSGEDWYEDEEEGEEMEDLDTIDGEEEEEEEEDNGDWMIDDEEEELEQEEEDGDLVLSLDEIGSGLVPLSPKGKRKADNVYSFKNKRRKLATLKPDCKGPFWETTLGEARLPSFSRYAVRVLNDTSLSIDPFVVYGQLPVTSTAGKNTDGFAVPALPDRLPTTSNTASPNTKPISKKQGTAQGVAKAGPSRLPDHLMQKMAALVLDAPSGTTQVLLVDQVHQALKAEGAKKNAVEATLKQVFEKMKGQKRWVVKEEFKNMLGDQTS